MKVLAIDPGNIQSAYILWDGKKVHHKGIIPNDDIFEILDDFVFFYEGGYLAIEKMQSFGMAVGATVFDTVEWIGRFKQHAIHIGIQNITLVKRTDVKMHHCHSSRAKDSNIRQALIDRFGPVGKKASPNPIYNDAEEKLSKDKWSAFAIGVMVYDKLNP